ncbi:ABC transporter substrate-binding protein [Hirschia baltica]|uniref:4,5-dihydroxyphthalate decarboxylase n=1 Tax=Hirschia baltica (strain ATCC 49814 / DSM 5838 / IFAM 1418) TaxID=582402 RepID=C6XPL1_HIRBI|nr:ABC transporter substrate-binding protein [Hirschia baltica]ACT60276.1 4,5-dihydroxyphthalate decarboxylase [Hirschia baltica ATCC 49814]
MSKQKVPLKIAVAELPHTSAVRNGSIPIEGVDAEFLTIQPQIAAFRRMVRDLEFDVCELAPTTYIIARAHGIPIIALPIFVLRRFHHSGLLVRPDAGIKVPKDLEGKKAGVRAYSVTTGVWTRGILEEEFGLDNSKVTWVVDDEEHVSALKLPSNVIKTPAGRSLNDMMAKGELVAGFHGNAGVGRTGDPTSGWKSVEVDYPDMFENPEELEAEWYQRTNIYPMHGTIVVKEAVLKENPWIAKSLFDAFEQAKSEWLETLGTSGSDHPQDVKYRKYQKIVGHDPLPYGIDENIESIKALERIAFSQGMLPKRMSVDELFVDPRKV